MTGQSVPTIRAGQVVVACRDLDKTLSIFVDRLGFKIETIFPADSPQVAVVFGYGVALRLERTATVSRTEPVCLRLESDDPALDDVQTLSLPDGVLVEIVPPQPGFLMPDGTQSFVHTAFDDSGWGVGRAGMLYRDLIPDRQGGRFIASHIRITDGGPVPDYVHLHRIRFQMIYFCKGWVPLVRPMG